VHQSNPAASSARLAPASSNAIQEHAAAQHDRLQPQVVRARRASARTSATSARGTRAGRGDLDAARRSPPAPAPRAASAINGRRGGGLAHLEAVVVAARTPHATGLQSIAACASKSTVCARRAAS